MLLLKSQRVLAMGPRVRPLILAILTCGLLTVMTLLNPPGNAEAGCFTKAPACDIFAEAGGATADYEGNGNFTITFELATGVTGGSSGSTCGVGGVDCIGISPSALCVGPGPGQYQFQVFAAEAPLTVTFRVRAYVDGTLPRKRTVTFTVQDLQSEAFQLCLP